MLDRRLLSNFLKSAYFQLIRTWSMGFNHAAFVPSELATWLFGGIKVWQSRQSSYWTHPKTLKMALLSRCLCCSLLTASIFFGITSMVSQNFQKTQEKVLQFFQVHGQEKPSSTLETKVKLGNLGSGKTSNADLRWVCPHLECVVK